MTSAKSTLRKAALEGLYFSGASKLFRSWGGGVGAILTLHRVRPSRKDVFQPNKALEVTPEFLEDTIVWLRRNRNDLVSLDEARSRLVNRRFDRRFVAITLDDGYRDNNVWARPIFTKHDVPYTIYIPTEFAEGRGNLWWTALEEMVARNDRLEADDRLIMCGSLREKFQAYALLKQIIIDLPERAAEMAFLARLAARHRYDAMAMAREACMNWDEIRDLATDRFAAVEAHTLSHPLLAKLTHDACRAELVQSRAILQDKLQREVRHLAYPYGCEGAVGEREFSIAAAVGYSTAVTTRHGTLHEGDVCGLHMLPRINLDGEFQKQRYLETLLSGVAQAAWSGVKAVQSLGSRRKAVA